MQALRSLRLTARLVLVWFALTLGVGMASPIVAPQQWDVVCSSSGDMKLVVVGDSALAPHHLDCPMCLTTLALPGVDTMPQLPQAQPLGRAAQPIVAARLAAVVGAPLPPRGPPPSV
ncbi:DUF2946 family protein [Comamonas sp. 4034]|uniref:DUF2946 family protein n=1 Tax=Comamonas sp. 4034 TaxID=3156455 RepID=UPI003D221CFD